MSKAPNALQMERLKRLAALPDDKIDTVDLPVVADWSRGIRGGTPREVRERAAAQQERSAREPTVRSERTHFKSWTITHSSTKQRSWYRYEFKVGKTIRHSGITQDPHRREIEHRLLWPTGRIVILCPAMSARAAREWESTKNWGYPPLRSRKR